MAWFGLAEDKILSIKAANDDSSFVPDFSNSSISVNAPNNDEKVDFAPVNDSGGVIFHPYRKQNNYNAELSSDALAKLYVVNSAFWAAVNQLTKPANAARLVLRERRGGNWKQNDDHEIIKWWRGSINPEMTGSTFIVARFVHLSTYGVFRAEWTPENCEAPDARDKQGVAIDGGSLENPWLTPCNPDVLMPDVRKDIKVDASGRVLLPPTNVHGKLYRYVHLADLQNKKGYPVTIGDVYVESNYNPQRGYEGVAPLRIVANVLGMGDSLIRHAQQYLGNNAIPSMFFKYKYDTQKGDAPEVPQKERSRFMQEFMNLFSLSGERSGAPTFLPGNTDVEKLTPDIDKLMPADLMDITQAIVHEVLGTSAMDSLVGLRHVKNTGAGTKSHQTSVWRYTVEPQMHLAAESLSGFLFEKFSGGKDFERWQNGDIELTWDFSKVPAWRQIQEEHNKTVVDSWGINAPITVNEFRGALGFPAVNDARGNLMSFEINAPKPVNPDDKNKKTEAANLVEK